METNKEVMRFTTLETIRYDSKASFESNNACPYSQKTMISV
jgi:hypothetical protein